MKNNTMIKNNYDLSLLCNERLRSIVYDTTGFHIDGNTYPFYSFSKPDGKGCWSNEMTTCLEEASKHHWIDVYNRRIALDGVADVLCHDAPLYIDIGCSSGYMLEDVSTRFPHSTIVGADYFNAGLMQCHDRLPSIPLFQMDLTECPFADNVFDAITCLNVLEHIQDDEAALCQLSRILKQGGRIVLTVPMGQHMYDLYDEVHYHVRRYAMHDLIQKVQCAGLTIITCNYFGAFAYPAFYITKKINQHRYGTLSLDEKKRLVSQQISRTEHSHIMKMLCEIEYTLGRVVKYPFGIRGYIIATK